MNPTLNQGGLMVRVLISVVATLSSALAFANSPSFNFNFKDKDLSEVISEYSHQTGEKFIMEKGVTGKVTMIFPKEIDQNEAFNALSEALKINNYGIIKVGDHSEIRSVNQLTKDGIEVYTNLPEIQPARIVTYYRTLKFAEADKVMRTLRAYVNQNGDITPIERQNAVMITDWTTNIARLDKIIDQMDVEVASASAVAAAPKASAPKAKK
jgi:general secretion pathway protein D